MDAGSVEAKIQLPGYGIALNQGVEKYESDTIDKRFPNALQGEGYSGPLLAVREYTMIDFMNRITDKAGWEKKAYNESITAKWRLEAPATPNVDISDKMIDWCIAELQYKAKLFEEHNFVEALDGIFKSDTIIPEELRQSLFRAVAPLENIPDKKKDWHPGSDEQVLDLVHPSLFPLVYGHSRILPRSAVGIQDCLEACGRGEIIPIPSDEEVKDPRRLATRYRFMDDGNNPKAWSKKYQWLPSEFQIPPDGDDVSIESYINNLHPHRYGELYDIISQVVSKVIPLWNATLTPLQDYWTPPPRIEMEGDGYQESDEAEPEYPSEDDGWDAYETAHEAWQENRVIVQLEPKEFEPLEVRILAKYDSRFEERKEPLDLRKKYGKLQIIVKLANIHLTPEKPKYEGGSWHVEGQLNENICATALYYYDSDNISESLLAFRSKVDDGQDLVYEQGDHKALETIYGFENEGPSIQELGKVVTKSGRLLTFPNIFQHRVQPFHLQDPSKPGHRKILALFLVDPHKPIISTANIPCQQKEWWEELIRNIGPLGKVPKEINQHILGMVDDFPISLEKAKEQRLELMEERKHLQVCRFPLHRVHIDNSNNSVADQNELFESHTFSDPHDVAVHEHLTDILAVGTNEPALTQSDILHLWFLHVIGGKMNTIVSAIRNYSWIGAGVGILLALVCKYIYRLTLHPLAKFPGPKLAGATSLYGAFFDLRGKSYVKSFPALHEQYGPIVRAWPDTLHIYDMEVYNQIFKIGAHFDKLAIFYESPMIQDGFFPDSCQETALRRRGMYAPYFSREAIRGAEPRVAACVAKFLDNLNHFAQNGKSVDMTKGVMCYTMDGIMNFIYQKPFGALDAEDFDSDYVLPMEDFVDTLQWSKYFPRLFGRLYKLTDMLPEWGLERSLKGLLTTKKMLKMCNSRIKHLLSIPSGKDRPASAFETNLAPNLEKGQFTPSEQGLTSDAFTFFSAGTETSSQTLDVAIFNLLDGPTHMLERLKGEVRHVIHEKKTIVEWATLEKLPYLRAVVKESLRLSYGIPGRIPRVVPPEGATFCGEHIPPGVLVASSTYVHHMNPEVFPSPEEFRPERWLDGDPKLDQYLVSFSRGSRACIGINLAYCEIYLLLAHLFRRFDLQLAGTSKKDMEWIDCFVPKRNTHLYVTAKEVED